MNLKSKYDDFQSSFFCLQFQITYIIVKCFVLVYIFFKTKIYCLNHNHKIILYICTLPDCVYMCLGLYRIYSPTDSLIIINIKYICSI